MSGHKKLLLSANRDYERWLQGDELRQRVNPVNLPEIVTEINRRALPVIEELRNSADQREDHFLRLVANDLPAAATYAGELQSAIHGLQNQVLTTLNETLYDFSQNIQQQFQNDRDAFQQSLTDVEQNFETRFQDLQAQEDERLWTIAEHTGQLVESATDWIETAEKTLGDLCNSYPASWLSQDEIEHLQHQINIARQNFDQGLYEAALALAQQTFMAGLRLRLCLERTQASWTFYSQRIWEQVWLLNEQIAANSVVNAIDAGGETLECPVEVDHWTAGGLQQLQNEVQALYQRCQTEDTALLQAVFEKDLPALQEQLKDQVLRARMAVLDAQVRVNIADITAQALQIQGFGVERAGYAGEDPRQAYEVEMVHLDGSRIHLSIRPVEALPGQNELHLISSDTVIRNEHELQRRANEIQQILSNHGLQVQSVAAVPAAGLTQHSRPPYRHVHETTALPHLTEK